MDLFSTMKHSLFILLIVSLPFWLSAQNSYFPMQCEGEIPSDFLESTSTKIDKDNHTKNKKELGISRKEIKDFNAINNYYVDLLLKGGQIVFGTDMNDYVNKVGGLVIDNFDGIERDDIHFYIVKSSSVNAFTTENGIIFINVGLIAQLENEAQLAYVIAHELVHYKYHHAINSYTRKTTRSSSSITRNKQTVDALEYSREQEFLADSIGFVDAFMKLDYDFNQVLNLFDVLLYSNLPFDEIEFRADFFNDTNYVVDSDYMLGKVDLISNPDEYDDTYLTHPNIKRRRNRMIDLVTNFESKKKDKFIINEDIFKELQKQARFEMSNLYIIDFEYAKAFYNSYLLMRKYPDNKYLNKTITYSLYALAQLKLNDKLGKSVTHYSRVEGNSQRVNYFFIEAKTKDVGFLALKRLWNYKQQFPADKYMSDLLDDITYNLIDEYHFKMGHFYSPLHKRVEGDSISKEDEFKELSKTEYEDLSKYDKIRYDKKYEKYFGSDHNQSSSVFKTENYRYILSTETTDDDFKKYYSGIYNKVEKKKAVEEILESVVTEANVTVTIREASDTLNIDKMILVNPVYYYVKRGEFKINNFEEKETQISESFVHVAKAGGIDVTLVDVLDIRRNNVAKFNDIAFMNSWLVELENVTTSYGNSIMIPWQTNYLYKIMDKYDMRYISSYGVLDEKGFINPIQKYMNVIGAALFFPASPYFIANIFRGNNTVEHLFYCVDLKTNKIVYYNKEQIEGKSNKDFIDLLNYNVINDLNKL